MSRRDATVADVLARCPGLLDERDPHGDTCSGLGAQFEAGDCP